MADLSRVNLRPMRAEDVELSIVAILEGGWGNRRAALEFYFPHPETQPFVAEADGEIVGTALATRNGDVGWLGLVFVAPGWRGRGLGAAVTKVALDYLHQVGSRSVVLAATDLGQPIYQRLGFAPQGGYTILEGTRRGTPPLDQQLRPLRSSDLPLVLDLDRRASGEDRSHMIRSLPNGWVVAAGAEIRGYALRTPWGIGPAIAFDAADGRLLLELLRSEARDERMLLVIPTQNVAAAEHLRNEGFVAQRSLPRMVLGDPIDWRPDAVWTIFNFAIG